MRIIRNLLLNDFLFQAMSEAMKDAFEKQLDNCEQMKSVAHTYTNKQESSIWEWDCFSSFIEFWSSERNTENMMSDLYFNEESDYSEENISNNKDFCSTILQPF